MRLFQTILLLFFLQLVVSCSVKVYESRVTQENPNGPWLKGRQMQVDSLGGIIVLVNYETWNEDVFIYHIGVTNHSDRPIVVDPTLFSSKGFGFNLKDGDTLNYCRVRPAMNPETLLASLDDDINHQKAEYKRAGQRQDAMLFMDVLLALAPSRETAIERDRRRVHDNQYYTNQKLNQARLRTNIEDDENWKKELENEMLRKTTLLPGSSIAGLVYFHRHNKASRFKLTLPVDSSMFQVTYLHSLVEKSY